MRQCGTIAARIALFTFVLAGHVCTGDRAEGQGSHRTSNMPAAARSSLSIEQFVLRPEAVCVATSKARQSSSDNAWSNDPAEMYVRALPQDRRNTAPAGSSSLSKAPKADVADRNADRSAVTVDVANAAGPGAQPGADQTGRWLTVAIPLAAGGMVLALAGLLFSVRQRRRRTIPHAAFLNLAGYSPIAPASAPASTTATDKRRAA